MNDIKHAIDTLAISAWVGTLLNIVPELLSLATLMWAILRVYETYQNIKLKKLERAKLEREMENDRQPQDRGSAS